MKKKLYSILAGIIILSGFYACDKIKDGDYYKPVTAGASDRKVLIEDYTGQKCGNWPRAAETALQLKNLYGDNVVIMAVHVGFFAVPDSKGTFTYDFRTPAGNALDSIYGISAAGLPQGMVNRKIFSGSPIVAYGAWGQSVAQIINTPPDMIIDTLTASFDSLAKTVTVKTNTKFAKTLTGKYNIVVCITEDSIIKPQEDYSKSPQIITNYVHHHALRATLTGTFGEFLVSAPTAASRVKKEYIKVPVKDTDWNPQHLSAIVFITDASTNEVLQVNESHIH